MIGAAFIVVVPNIASDISQSFTGAVFGALLILFVYFFSDGLPGLVKRGARVFGRGPEAPSGRTRP